MFFLKREIVTQEGQIQEQEACAWKESGKSGKVEKHVEKISASSPSGTALELEKHYCFKLHHV